MSEHSEMLAQMVDRLFGDIAGTDQPVAEAWASVEALGIPALFLTEAQGGMEGSFADAALVFRLSGYHGLPLPIGETMLGRQLLAGAGIALPEGPLAVGAGEGELSLAKAFTGTIRAQSCTPEGALLIATAGNGVAILIDPSHAGRVDPSANAAGQSRDCFHFADAPFIPIEGVEADTLFQRFAFLRAAQIGGALTACLDYSIRYAHERSQFGRELRKFQAIQHQIALIAEEAAAVGTASAAAAAALDRGGASFEIACAKLRANQATGATALMAHQIHGAIGITEEYGLHRFTCRLWAWRSEFGNDRYWSQKLGRLMLSNDSAAPWHMINCGGRA